MQKCKSIKIMSIKRNISKFQGKRTDSGNFVIDCRYTLEQKGKLLQGMFEI